MPTRTPSSSRSASERGDRTNISGVESGSTKGWIVRFQRDGVKHSQFFRDDAHDGPDGAFDAAKVWRDEVRQALGPVGTPDPSRMHTPAARAKNRKALSRTGVTGIGFLVREFSAQHVPYVTAYWLDEGGRRRQTSFSIQRHGVEDALRLAARARAATSDWHGEEPRDALDLYMAAIDRVRELAAPYINDQ